MYKFWKYLAMGALSLGASVALESGAQADGYYVRGYAPVQPAFSWSGLYIGGGAGYAWGHGLEDMFVSGVFNQRPSPDLSKGIVGGHIGVNYQTGSLVVGAEAQVLSSISGDENAIFFPFVAACAGGPCLVNGKIDIRETLLFKGRVGIAFGRWLPYVTAGIVSGDIHSRFRDVNFNGGTNVVSDSKWHSGWTVGGGIDYALTRNWILGVEYQHIFFDDGLHQGFNNFLGNVHDRDHLVNADADTVMARLSYKFGPREEYRPLK